MYYAVVHCESIYEVPLVRRLDHSDDQSRAQTNIIILLSFLLNSPKFKRMWGALPLLDFFIDCLGLEYKWINLVHQIHSKDHSCSEGHSRVEG